MAAHAGTLCSNVQHFVQVERMLKMDCAWGGKRPRTVSYLVRTSFFCVGMVREKMQREPWCPLPMKGH